MTSTSSICNTQRVVFMRDEVIAAEDINCVITAISDSFRCGGVVSLKCPEKLKKTDYRVLFQKTRPPQLLCQIYRQDTLIYSFIVNLSAVDLYCVICFEQTKPEESEWLSYFEKCVAWAWRIKEKPAN